MKKYIALTITIISIMCFIVAFSVKGVEDYKLNKGYVPTSTADVAVKNVKTEAKPTSELEKSEVKYNKAVSPRNQENVLIHLDGAITKHTEKKPEKAAKSEGERKIDPQKPMVALTFDDGPHPEYTMQILKCLKKYNGLATFFVVGSRAEKYKNVIKSIAENGDEIGNHTYDHKRLTRLSSKAITNELTKTNNILQNITGIKPGLIRPTYGSVNNNVKLYSDAPLILWSIDTLDWKTRNEKMIVKEVSRNAKDGDIILMHDIYRTTAMAAEVIIKELSSRGYQLVTIEELYTARGLGLVNGKVYRNAYMKK